MNLYVSTGSMCTSQVRMLVDFLVILILSYWFAGISWVPIIPSLEHMLIMTPNDVNLGYLGKPSSLLPAGLDAL